MEITKEAYVDYMPEELIKLTKIRHFLFLTHAFLTASEALCHRSASAAS